MSYDYELFVIGAGSGGVRASRIAAGFGARVAVCEDSRVGGTCVNLGCVPKKLLVYASRYGDQPEDATAYGWSFGTPRFDWPTLIRNKDAEIDRLNGVYRRILHGAGVELVEGRGRVVDPNTVEVDGQHYKAERILVATGGRPFVPDVPGAELGITSDQVFHLDEMPKRVVIVGGGYIGVEFASIFSGLGAHVTLVGRGPLFLRGFDEDVRRTLAEEMSRRGVDLRFDCNVESVEKGGSLHVKLSEGTVLHADCLLWATGRVPKTDGLGLEDVGVALSESGAVEVDEGFQTSVPSIYAIGDVIDRVQLTPVALGEGMLLAKRLYGGSNATMSYDDIPTAVFSTPEIGTCGLPEHEARARGEIEVYRSTFTPMKHALTGRSEKTMMKLVVDRATDRVLGVHIVGPDAGEIVQGFAVAIQCGATKAQLDATVGIHPTAAEELVTMRTPVPSID